MDETQISITIKPMYIERLIYWIIIIVLAVLLVLSYLKDTSEESSTATTTTTKPVENAPTPVVEPPTSGTVKKDTCTDATLNGDETDVDCGGSCGVKCASTKACKTGSDCVSGTCTANVCTTAAPAGPTLSGKLELDVTKADFSVLTSGYPKITGFTYKITNGLAEDKRLIARVFIKSKSNVQCLNQVIDDGSCEDAFAEVSLGTIASGKSKTETHEFQTDELKSGSVMRAGKYYVKGDDVNVVVYIYDISGDMIDGKSITDAVLVST